MFKKQFICTIFILAFASALVLGNALFIDAGTNCSWDGTVASSFTSGSGTESDPYLISTPSELAFFAKSVNTGNSYENEYIKLACDIVMNDEKFIFESDSGLVKVSDTVNIAWVGTGICGDKSGGNEVFDGTASDMGAFYKSDVNSDRGSYGGSIHKHSPIGKSIYPFSGIFDGAGHTVSGIYCNESAQYGQGLFGYTEGAQIMNVIVENSYIYGDSFVGAIGGSLSFSNVFACACNALIFAKSEVGGVAGHLSDTELSQSYNIGTVSGSSKVGGIIGVSLGNVRDSYNAGNVYARSSAGGIVGQNLGKISTCYNAAKITAASDVGAISGYTQTMPESVFYLAGSVDASDNGMTDLQMRDIRSFSGFDFDKVWTFSGDTSYPYPTLLSVSHRTIEHTHTYSNDCDKTCNACGFERKITHDFGAQLHKDETSHFLVCNVCGELGSVSAHKYDDACDSICNICSYDRNVFHAFSAAWYSDGKCHWNECSRCGEKKNEEPHIPGEEATEDYAQTCKICTYIITPALAHKHSYTGKWLSSDDGHYRECECSQTGEVFPHEWDSGTLTRFPTADTPGVMTYKCDICSRKRTELVEDITEIVDPDDDNAGETNDGEDLPDDTEIKWENLRENNIYPDGDEKRDISLALSIGALVIGFLNLAMFAAIIVILLRKNGNGRKK